jgi:predicted NBD/HSP70 family sugar kinase
MRVENRALVIDAIFAARYTSRAELSKLLKLSKPTVNEHVDQLVKEKIAIELGKGRPIRRGGRRPTMVAPNGGRAYVLALDASQQSPVVAVGDLLREPVDRTYLEPGEVRAESALCAARELLARNSIAEGSVEAVVIAAPTGEAPGYSGADYFAAFSGAFGAALTIKRSADMALAGELKYLGGEDGRSLLLINCGRDITASLAIGGSLFDGANGRDGRIGGMATRFGAARYSCCRGETEDFERDAESVGAALADVIVSAAALTGIDTALIGGNAATFFDALSPVIAREIGKAGAGVDVVPVSLGSVGGIIGCFETGARGVIARLAQI